MFTNFAPFTNSISKISNTQIDNAKDTEVVITMYSFIECTNSCSKTSEISWIYYRYVPALHNAGTVANFPNNSALFKFKQKRKPVEHVPIAQIMFK